VSSAPRGVFLPRDALVEDGVRLGLGQRIDPGGLALGIDASAGIEIAGPGGGIAGRGQRRRVYSGR